MICKSLRDYMIKSIAKKIAVMKANGSNCADLYAKLEQWSK